MNWTILGGIFYLLVVALVCLRIIFETHSTTKTLAYLLLTLLFPVFGIVFYITFGVNYWRIKKYRKKSTSDTSILQHLEKNSKVYKDASVNTDDAALEQNSELASLLLKDLGSPLTRGNSVQLLINGEEKFPDMLDAIRNARHHIHLEYYIYECDQIGNELTELLIIKAKEGVEVKFIYDDFGSPGIKNKTERAMQAAGIEISPFHKVHFYLLANRINYRNHRKIVVIDGCTGFVGGINVSDKYINGDDPQKLFWRDTHIRLDGPAVYYLQYLFISDWNFCCQHSFGQFNNYFPAISAGKHNSHVQITASGPNSVQPSVLFSILQAIYLAKEEILITTPYFIPGDSILDALRISAISGLTVKLLVPGVADSKIVNAASKSNYNDLLKAGVEIYLYRKGFVHAKTMVTDSKLFIVGTANMDRRSFDLNFEVNAVVYDTALATKMRSIFFTDLESADKIDKEEWLNRKWYRQLPEKTCRLFSPVL
ncbi:MAG: cardiolipin synthase [Ferruginibacter sp.]|nr:cardiolipin synthase [Chitinophagaceae bacterium]